jgi:superfamily I DNA/RNA helicase
MIPLAAAAAPDLDPEQLAAVDAPLAAGALSLVGAAGTGKSFALVRRAVRLAAATSGAAVLVTAPSDAGVARLRAALVALNPRPSLECASLGDAAFAVLRAAGSAQTIEAIDDVRAALHFERAGAELFALEWTEFVSAQIDPEITGMRAPERFCAAAFRLIRKLRAALISPESFKACGLRGATAFYGNPPNFANTDLLADTPSKYRDSLRVTAEELERQRTREVDLVKILTRLYTSYVETLVAHGCLTATDAVYEAALLLRERPDVRLDAARRYAAILVDDAQDLTPAQLALLAGIAQGELGNVTFAGDPEQRTRGFATGARGWNSSKGSARTVALGTRHGGAPAIALLRSSPLPGTFSFFRAETMPEEAQEVASEIARLIATGMPPEEIAVITRNLRCAHSYVAALLARNVPTDVGGAASLYDFPATADALAALYSVVDPFRHDYLLRALQAPWMRLADASLATLCADAADPQTLLFEIDGDDAESRETRRWDQRRNLRLARNVTRGDVDGDLPREARERLGAFRAARARYERAARGLEPSQLARLIFDETVLATAGHDARGRFTRGLVDRLQSDIDAFFAREPLASLEEYLRYAESVAASESDLLSIAPTGATAVRVLDVEAAKGQTFGAVFVVDVRAGAWPRYYAPDAFLFIPSLGMIPKENVGDARAARTAKFTYASSYHRLREKYNAEERRALYCALTRARDYVSISASGRATRGISTPELLEEIRAALGR